MRCDGCRPYLGDKKAAASGRGGAASRGGRTGGGGAGRQGRAGRQAGRQGRQAGQGRKESGIRGGLGMSLAGGFSDGQRGVRAGGRGCAGGFWTCLARAQGGLGPGRRSRRTRAMLRRSLP